MTSCPEAMGWGFWNLKKNRIEIWAWTKQADFRSSPKPDQSFAPGAARDGLRWKSRHRKKFCLPLLMLKNLKLKKVVKSFVPEPKKKSCKCFIFFWFPMFMNICEHSWSYIFGRGYATLSLFVLWSLNLKLNPLFNPIGIFIRKLSL